MTAISPPQLGWRFWMLWSAISLIGALLYIAAFVVGAYVITPILSNGVFLPIGFCISFGSVGFIVGAAQRFILRRWGYETYRWVLFTTSGAAIGGAIYAFLVLVSPFRFQGVILGTSIGIMQWNGLNRLSHKAGLWILACTIGGMLDDVFTSGIFGTLSGAVTGLVLIWLLRHPIQRSDQPTLSSVSSM